MESQPAPSPALETSTAPPLSFGSRLRSLLTPRKHPPSPETFLVDQNLERRRRFLKYATGVVLLDGLARLGFRELVTPCPLTPDFPRPQTLQELQFVVRRELNVPIAVPETPSPEIDGQDAGSIIDLPQMIGNGLQHAADAGFTNIPGYARDFFRYYGEGDVPDLGRLRCNNHAYGACRSFSQYNMPMHLLAIAPSLRHLASRDWHVMAVCPLHGRSDGAHAHLVFDNGTALLWNHGDLGAFVSWSERNSPIDERRRISSYGIARYREPKYPIAHPLLMHIAYAVEEERMEALELNALFPRESSALA